jgi:hypothetical protein
MGNDRQYNVPLMGCQGNANLDESILSGLGYNL